MQIPNVANKLRERCPNLAELGRRLEISRPGVYGLVSPSHREYPIPAAVFDTRKDLADRISKLIKVSPNKVRLFYERERIRRNATDTD